MTLDRLIKALRRTQLDPAARIRSRTALLSFLLIGLTALVPPILSASPILPSGAPPRSLLAEVAENEVRAIRHPDSYLRYRMHTVDRKGDRVRDMIESKDGAVARLIFNNGKPVTAAEDEEERDRLKKLLDSPSAFSRHIHNDQTGKKLAAELVQLMPDAMTYSYAEGQPQVASSSSNHQIVLDYRPNPAWSAPSISAQALTGLRGRMWIDEPTHQLVRMEGTIFRGVNFGWGMLAHIYPGGALSLDQTGVGAGRWIFTRFVEHVKVRALLLKSIDEDALIEASNFQALPRALTYTEAIQQLLNTPLPRI